MGENKKTRKKIAKIERRVEEHQDKIRQMLKRPHPDFGLIGHWEREISGHLKTLNRLYKRLPGKEKK